MRLRELDVPLKGESWESQNAARRHNPASVIRFTLKGKKRRHVLPCGDSDSVYLYSMDETVYCVSINTALDYCGVQAYEAEDQEPPMEGSLFLQSSEQIDEVVGRDALNRLTPRTIANRLINHLEEARA